MFGKIVVGTDGFGPASKAVDRAVELAESSGAELIVVNVHAPYDASALRDAGPGPDASIGLLDTVRKKYEERVRLRTVSESGDPAEVLIDLAEREGADLIVVGNKGMRQRFALGAVPNQVSHHAPCSILIVRTTEDQ